MFFTSFDPYTVDTKSPPTTLTVITFQFTCVQNAFLGSIFKTLVQTSYARTSSPFCLNTVEASTQAPDLVAYPRGEGFFLNKFKY